MVDDLDAMESFLSENAAHLHRATPYNHGTASSNDRVDGPQWITYCQD
jgi:hypothetical protein